METQNKNIDYTDICKPEFISPLSVTGYNEKSQLKTLYIAGDNLHIYFTGFNNLSQKNDLEYLTHFKNAVEIFDTQDKLLLFEKADDLFLYKKDDQTYIICPSYN